MVPLNHPSVLFSLVLLAGVALGTALLPSPSSSTVPIPTVSVAEQDHDRDGIPDLFDLCPTAANTGLPDSDGDGTRDPCDLDPDDDGRMRVVFDGVWLMGRND